VYELIEDADFTIVVSKNWKTGELFYSKGCRKVQL